MKMGTAYKQNISVQHRQWNKLGVQKTNPVEFEKWFLQGLRKYEKKGAEFELLPGMVKIQWPGKVAVLRSVEDFKREYQKQYLGQELTA